MRSMRPLLVRLVVAGGGTREDVSRIIEETIIILYTKTEIPVLTSAFQTYFYGIAKRIWMSEMRRRQKQPKEVELADIYADSESPSQEILELRAGLVYKYYHQLPKHCQDILRMIAYGYSNEDIADSMGFSSVQYAKNRKSDCMKRLIEMIESDPLYPELITY